MSILSDSQKLAIRAVMDAMLNDWGKPCKLWFPPIDEDCDQCLNFAHLSDGNVGLHGGPMAGLCPFCGGSRKRKKEVTDTINLEIDYTNKLNRQSWVVEGPGIKLPYDVITVKGYLTDLPKLQKSIEIQVNLPGFPHIKGRYVLLSDGESPFAIVQERYFLTSLKRQS